MAGWLKSDTGIHQENYLVDQHYAIGHYVSNEK
jgi:hypothetical protein